MNELEEILNNPDENNNGYSVEVDIKYPDEIKEKTKNFPFCPENKFIPNDVFSKNVKGMKLDKYIQNKKWVCDWTDQKNYLIHYRMITFFVGHGMIVNKIHEIISFGQSMWLEKYINFITQTRNKARNDFEKDFYKLLKNVFYGKGMENVRNRVRQDFIKKDDTEKNY